MIAESSPWKDQLERDAGLIEKAAHAKRRTMNRLLALEKSVFFSAYAMRKLWDSHKLSTNWKDRTVRLNQFKPMGRAPNLFNWHRIDEHYDLEKGTPTSITAIELCHRLIHSYIFVEKELEDKSIEGFFFASDTTKSKGLWYLRLTDYVSLMRITGKDYPAKAQAERDPKTGDWIFWQGEGTAPPNWREIANRNRR